MFDYARLTNELQFMRGLDLAMQLLGIVKGEISEALGEFYSTEEISSIPSVHTKTTTPLNTSEKLSPKAELFRH